jgi:hypothetical protein
MPAMLLAPNGHLLVSNSEVWSDRTEAESHQEASRVWNGKKS